MPFGDIFEKISNKYYQLTSAEKKVADYTVIHQQKTQFVSISELAEKTDVTEAIVSHFCRRLGYKGHSAFRLAVADSTTRQVETPTISGEIRPEGSTEELCQKLYATGQDAMAQTVELIRPDSVWKAADLLLSAEKVLCMGQRGSMILAQECAHLFNTARPNLYAVLDSHMQAIVASHLTAQNVILYFSYSGSTEELLKNLKIIRDRRAVAILITRFPKSPGAAYADVVLRCDSLGEPLQGGSMAAHVVQFYLMDVLFREVCHKDI